MMTSILAEAAAATVGPMIPGEWIIALVVAIIGAVGGVYLKRSGREEGRAETATTIANQPLTIAMTQTPVSYTHLTLPTN